VPRCRHGALPPARVTGGDDAHHPAQWRFGDPDGHVNVIRHPAMGEQRGAVTVEGFGKDFLEAQILVAAAEDSLVVITAQHGVIDAARDMNSTLAWHRRIRAGRVCKSWPGQVAVGPLRIGPVDADIETVTPAP